jgi:hypothetical protein
MFILFFLFETGCRSLLQKRSLPEKKIGICNYCSQKTEAKTAHNENYIMVEICTKKNGLNKLQNTNIIKSDDTDQIQLLICFNKAEYTVQMTNY